MESAFGEKKEKMTKKKKSILVKNNLFNIFCNVKDDGF